MGSGHFVVAISDRLVALSMAEMKLTETEAISAVIPEATQRTNEAGSFHRMAVLAAHCRGFLRDPMQNFGETRNIRLRARTLRRGSSRFYEDGLHFGRLNFLWYNEAQGLGEIS